MRDRGRARRRRSLEKKPRRQTQQRPRRRRTPLARSSIASAIARGRYEPDPIDIAPLQPLLYLLVGSFLTRGETDFAPARLRAVAIASPMSLNACWPAGPAAGW